MKFSKSWYLLLDMPENTFDQELISTNLIGATCLEELYNKEQALTHSRMLAIKQEPIIGKFDYLHLKAIHRFLFEGIYSWAGQDRYEAGIVADFGKGHTRFTSWEKVPAVAQELFGALRAEGYFAKQDAETFVKSAASFMNGLNLLHPFREGNGRVQRIFMEYLAANAGHEISFDHIAAEEMVRASVEGVAGRLYVMEALIKKACCR